MNQLPQITPVSTLKHDHLAVLAQLKKGPVVLASRSKPVGVLVAPAQWDALAERVDSLEALVSALQAELALQSGEEALEDIDLEELKAQTGRETVAHSVD
jgi:hypothetical protein